MRSRSSADPHGAGVVAAALMLVAMCIMLAGVLAYAGGVGTVAPTACACPCAPGER